MSAMRVSRHAPACNVIKDDNGIITKVFVAGGWNTDAGYMKSTEIYDLSDDSWTDGPDFGSAIYESKMITAPSSSSYAAFIMTGLRDADRQKDIDGISKDLTQWTKLGSIEAERAAATVLMIPPNMFDGCTKASLGKIS